MKLLKRLTRHLAHEAKTAATAKAAAPVAHRRRLPQRRPQPPDRFA